MSSLHADEGSAGRASGVLTDSEHSTQHAGAEHVSRLSSAVVDAANNSKKTKAARTLQNFQLATLKLAGLNLHGREGDLKLLKEKLRNIKDAGNELLLVEGHSGTGKSALVTRGLRDPAKRMGIAFVGGKFDQYLAALPYSAFAHALSELSKQILSKPTDVKNKVQSDVEEALGTDGMQLVSRAMPGCEGLFSLKSAPPRRPSTIGGKEAANRMKYAVRQLMNVICTNMKKGVVWFIDDLQWADAASLELLQSLLQDGDIPSLLLVGAYRDDEVSDSHPLTLQIREAERLGSTITKIKVGNLDRPTVQSLVAEALRMEDKEEKVESLSSIVHLKTEGNAFFVLFFLTSLYDDDLLQYNFGAMRWMWDDDRVKEKLVTENVATVMVNKLQSYSAVFQNVMKVASCLGASFSTNMLSLVVKKTTEKERRYSRSLSFSDDETDASSCVDDVVDLYVSDGLWEREPETEEVRFAHDQIQNAAFEQIPEEERAAVKGVIGGVLMKSLDKEVLEEALFEVLSLRNSAVSSLSEEERMNLAKMNIRAGLKATESAAPDTAVTYFKVARELIGTRGWEEDQASTIKLYSEEAQARFLIGDKSNMENLIEEVLSRDDISITDKFRAYEVKIIASQTSNKLEQSISMAMDLRKQLGFKRIPTKVSMARVMKDFLLTLHAVRGRTAEQLAALPELTDEKLIMGRRCMEMCATTAHMCNEVCQRFVCPNSARSHHLALPTLPQKLYLVLVLRIVRDTIAHGLNKSSVDGFASFALVLFAIFGDMKRGGEMCKTAELFLDRDIPGIMQPCGTVYTIKTFLQSYTAPLQATLQPMLQSYMYSMEQGDVETACWTLTFRNCNLWLTARPLNELEHELQTSASVQDEMHQVASRNALLPYLQAVINLGSHTVKPWVLSGDVMDFETMMELALKEKNDMLRVYVAVMQLELFVIFQDWDAAKALLIKAGTLRTLLHDTRVVFLRGLISLKAAQSSASPIEKRKWIQKAKRCIKTLKGRLQKGNVNVVHTTHILEAEYHALRGKAAAAEESFKEAITASSRSGFLQDRALSQELAGVYYMRKGDEYWARHNIQQSRQSYLDWQATAKAEHLGTKWSQFFSE